MGRVMTADDYRARAAEFSEMADRETNPRLQLEYGRMAESYFRLALHVAQTKKHETASPLPGRRPGSGADQKT
jgi:hypothetical protein